MDLPTVCWSILQKEMQFASWPLYAKSTKQKNVHSCMIFPQGFHTILHIFAQFFRRCTVTSKPLTLSHFLSLFLRRAWVVHWWELLPRTNMGGVQILVCGLSLLLIFSLALWGFFPGYFSVLLKNQHFQMPIRSECTDTFKGVVKNF